MTRSLLLFTDVLRKTFTPTRIAAVTLFMMSVTSFAQDVTITAATGGLATSPLTAGATNQAIFGIHFDKDGGGTNAVTGLVIQLDEDPTVRFTAARLVRSDDGTSFTAADLSNVVSTGSFSTAPNSIVFGGSLTNFSNDNGQVDRYLFVVVDVAPSAGATTAPVTPSVAITDVSLANDAVLGSTVTGSAYSFVDTTVPTITFNPPASSINVPITTNLTITFNEPVRKLDDSPITPADLATLVELKILNNAGANVPFTASIDVTNQIITVDPDPDLLNNTRYYLEINPVEDASGNATTASNITFNTPDNIAPTLTSSVPVDGSTGASETADIVLNFSELLRRADDVNLANGNIGPLLTLEEGGSGGTPVAFAATINAGDNIVTINPTSTLKSNTVYYVAITGVEDGNNNVISPDPTFITFTTGDTQPPVPSFNPTGGSSGHPVSGNIVITFNEPVRKLDDSPITPADLNTLVELKPTNDAGTALTFVASIDVTNTIITIDPTANLIGGQLYYLEINPVEDFLNQASTATNITFTTEPPPTFAGSPFSPSTTCVGDNITVTGNNFGSGALPSVTINGVTATAEPPLTAGTNTSFTFKVLAGMEGSGLTVTVTNNSNGLSSTSVSTVTIKPAIDTGLAFGVNPASPAAGQNYSILLGGTTQTTVSYSIRENGGSYTSATTGTGAQLSFGTYSHNTPGTYYYTIRATSTGCTTMYFPPASTSPPASTVGFPVTIANLEAHAGTDKLICAGEGVVLGASQSATGGTGYHSYSWAPTTGLSCTNCPNPVATPSAASTTYTLTVNDNGGNGPVTDDVIVDVKPLPTAQYISTDSIKTGFSDQDSVYLLSNKVKINPAGGTAVFTGLGVSKHSDNKFYFDPKVVGTQVNMPITFTYTGPNGCSNSDVLNVNVFPADAVIGLSEAYCSNVPESGTLTHNPTYIPASNASFIYSFKRLGFYTCDQGFMDPANPNNPMILDTSTPAPNDYILDIQKVVSGGYSNCYYIIVWINQRNISTGVDSEIYTGYKFFQISTIGKPPVITSIAEGEAICYNGSPIKLETNVPTYITNSYTIDDGTDNSIVTSGSDFFFDPTEITQYPAGKDTAHFVITYNYHDDNFQPAGGCANSVKRNFFMVKQVEAPTALDEQYCQFYEGRRILEVSSNIGSNDFHWYDGVTEVGTGATFDTQINTSNPTNKEYTVRQALYGCQGAADEATVIITPAPSSSLTIPPQCVGVNAVLNGPTTNVISWAWDLGDGTTANTQQVNHTYTNAGVFGLTLVVTSNTNGQVCSVTINEPVTVGEIPKPQFGYNFVCDGDATAFNVTTNIAVKDYQWNFGDGDVLPRTDGNNDILSPNNNGGRTTGKFKTPAHTFTDPGPYQVTVTTYTSLGCFDSQTKTVSILPYLTTFNSATPYEMANLNGGDGFWSVEDMKDSTTWTFDTPAKTIITSANQAWVTNAVGTYKSNDASVVNSPCLNIAGFQKPVISMDFALDTDQKSDGAVLEYSTNGGLTWKALGEPGSGQNWFNTVGFYSGKVGDSQVGWSGEMIGPANTWLEAKRKLDDIPIAQRGKVRFRIAFASNNDGNFEGFAFNNVTINERNRISLVELFTNEGANNYAANRDSLNTKLTTETVKIQYHVSFPGEDDISASNEVDPAARAAYYGITNNAGNIPRLFIDGESSGSFSNPWFNNFSAIRALKTAPFDITINTLPSPRPDQFTVSASVQSIVPMVAGAVFKKPIIHIAVIEKSVGSNQYVLRKLLPDPAGTEITLPKAKDAISTAGPYTWTLDNGTVEPNDLAIVVFVQDEVTKEVYQGEILLAPGNLPSVITGNEPELAELIRIYPNPANTEVIIQLPERVKTISPVTLTDNVGRTVRSNAFNPGEQKQTINTAELVPGVYVLEVSSGNARVKRKVVVVH
jgi:hypothetical protein